MSILEKYNKVMSEKDEIGMNEVLHDDFKFTMHASGKVLSKSDVISWAMSDDIAREKVRIVYEISKYKDNAIIYYRLGHAYKENDDYDNAVVNFKKASKLNPFKSEYKDDIRITKKNY